MKLKQTKNVLIVSYGPVPTSEFQKIEGGGMRCWGLAKGLQAQGIEVTVAINNAFPQTLNEYEGVKLTNWSPDDAFNGLLGAFDAVIASYCMGSDSVFIADNIPNDTQLILDLYVPIYVEVSARDSKDVDSEYRNYMADIKRFNHVLQRGDYFLCASEAQKSFYTGVLGALGIINPRSYREGRILIAPFGIHDLPIIPTHNPYLDIGISEKDFVVLWFGGLYPWFRVEELMNAINDLSSTKNIKFVIVGGKNPYNSDPNFVKQYTFAHKYATKFNLINNSLYFVDWVDFDDRINWFVNANLIISINNPGEENKFSWRTRVMEFVWGETAILTNGEDVLSEELLAKNAAVRLPELSAKSITGSIIDLVQKPEKIEQVKNDLHTVKQSYFWHEVVKPISAVIIKGKRPYVDERAYSDRILPKSTKSGSKNKLENYAQLFKKVVYHTKEGGVHHTAMLAKLKLEPRLNKAHLLKSRPRQFVFISHPIDNTGAPLVLMQIIKETVSKYGAKNIKVISPHIDYEHLRTLRTMGVNIEQASANVEPQIVRLQSNVKKDDFVLMNTLAVLPNYQNYFLEMLEDGRLKHAYWYIHEDLSQIEQMKASLNNKEYVNRVARLVKGKRLTIMVPSNKVKKDYESLLKADVSVIPLRVDVPMTYRKPRPVSNFNKLNFLITGNPLDGRKGQFIAISAFHIFVKKYYEKAPKQYRDFQLNLLAIGNDFIAQQIKSIVVPLLGKNHVKLYPPVPHQQALKITQSCNAVICCSFNETFAVYVAEGMFMEHVVLRNHSGGYKEQLSEGVNGYTIDESDIEQFARVVEKLLNKDTTSNIDLQRMGQASQKIITPYATHTYLDKIEAIHE